MSDKKSNKYRVEEQVKPAKVSVEEPLVTIQLLRHIKYIYTSPHTGTRYIWDKAGSQVDVPEKDAEILLVKTRKIGGCCGSGSKPHVVHFFVRR